VLAERLDVLAQRALVARPAGVVAVHAVVEDVRGMALGVEDVDQVLHARPDPTR
jgi:hypothetical protein